MGERKPIASLGRLQAAAQPCRKALETEPCSTPSPASLSWFMAGTGEKKKKPHNRQRWGDLPGKVYSRLQELGGTKNLFQLLL